MQVHINLGPGGPRIMASKIQERIERRGWVCAQQRLSQTGLADLSNRQFLAFVTCPPETSLPTPSLEKVGNPSHLTSKADIKKVIIIGELFVPRAGIVNPAEANTRGYGNWHSVKNHSIIGDGDRLPGSADWHADPSTAESDAGPGLLERIGRKWHSCQRGIKERPRDFEIRKYRKVFIAYITRERAIEDLPVCRRQGRCESGKVKEEVIPAAFVVSTELREEHPRVVNTRCAGIRIRINDIRVLIERRRLSVRRRMGKRRVHAWLRKTTWAKEHAGVQAKALDAAREIAAADVVTSEGNKEGIRRNVAVPAKEPVETLVEVGDDYDIGFIVACARFDPCLPLAHLVRGSQVGISVAAANFQTTEFVD